MSDYEPEMSSDKAAADIHSPSDGLSVTFSISEQWTSQTAKNAFLLHVKGKIPDLPEHTFIS